MPNVTILSITIVISRCLSGTIAAAKKLKFWLQVVLGPPFATACREIRKSGPGKSGLFRLYGRTSGSTPNGAESPIQDSDPGSLDFFRKSDFFIFFAFLKLKTRAIFSLFAP